MVEAMFIYFPSCQHSEVFFMFEEKLYDAQSGYEDTGACSLTSLLDENEQKASCPICSTNSETTPGTH
jgi:hypothetical protein